MFNVDFWFDYAAWNRNWSISDFREAFAIELDMLDVGAEMMTILYMTPIKVGISVHDLTNKVGDEVDHWIKALTDVGRRAEDRVIARAEGEHLVTMFRFPDAVGPACEQYLLYFVSVSKGPGDRS